jgi:NTF2 fold immunity protein of polymorphic toxin system component
MWRATLLSILVFNTCVLAQGYKPKSGFVPDSNTALRIAEAVLVPVYGQKHIDSEKPFTANLKDGVWTISGTLRCPDGKVGTTTFCDGGVATVKISKDDARVLEMVHYK